MSKRSTPLFDKRYIIMVILLILILPSKSYAYTLTHLDSIQEKDTIKITKEQLDNLIQNKEFKTALKSTSKFLKSNENDTWYLKKRAQLYILLNHLDSAQYDLEKTLVLTKGKDKQSLNNLGYILLKNQQWDLAIKHFERALEENPNYDIAKLNLALINIRFHKYSEACFLLNESLRGNLDGQHQIQAKIKFQQYCN